MCGRKIGALSSLHERSRMKVVSVAWVASDGMSHNAYSAVSLAPHELITQGRRELTAERWCASRKCILRHVELVV